MTWKHVLLKANGPGQCQMCRHPGVATRGSWRRLAGGPVWWPHCQQLCLTLHQATTESASLVLFTDIVQQSPDALTYSSVVCITEKQTHAGQCT